MVANYFTLLHLTKSLSARLSGLVLRALFSQQRSTLVLGAGKDSREEWIEISCEASSNYLVPRPGFARARKNSIDVFPDLTGSAITGMTMHPSDRQVSIHFTSGDRLLMQFYGPTANVHWVSSTHLIRASFLTSKSLVGTLLLDPDAKPFHVPESFEDLLLHNDGGPLRTSLRAALPQMGPLYIREALFRGAFTGQETLPEVSPSRQRALVDALRSVLDELMSPPLARLYERKDEAPVLSLCRLGHLEEAEMHTVDTLEEAVAKRIALQYRSRGFVEEKGHVLSQLDRVIRRTGQTLQKVSEESAKASRAQQYERFGSLVMANLAMLTKGMTMVECEDIFDPDRPRLRIPLERALSPAQNAERYFTKAKKARTAASDTELRRASLEKELRQAQALRMSLEAAESRDELTSCVADHRIQLKKFGISSSRTPDKAEPARVPFRVFTVAGNFTVWAGKSSENNDVLTMKHARPNDLWFHARGSGGSHVVLRAGTGKGDISKRAMEQAAQIAAYYSKMRNASTVPVAMTQRKYIRKPKGAPPGTVTIEREKVLFVEPRLPEQPANEEDE